MKKKLIILIGMSGSGKSTILHSISKKYSLNIIPQWTTRLKRKIEEKGSDYFFCTKGNSPLVKDLITHYSTKTVYGIWHYGFTRQQFEDNPNKINILVTDLESAKKLKVALKDQYDTYIIFLNPPVRTIQERLVNRGDNPKEVERRLLADLIDFQYAHKICDLELNVSKLLNAQNSIYEFLVGEGVL